MEKIYQLLPKIISFIQSPSFQRFFTFVKGFFILITFLMIGAIIYFLCKTTYLKYYFLEDLIEFLSFKSFAGRKKMKRWKKVKKWISSKRESDLKVAIIEANRLLYECLEERGIKGRDILEKLENVSPKLLPLDVFEKIKKAFEIYKNIIEDPSFKISQKEAKKIINDYERVLKELGFLE